MKNHFFFKQGNFRPSKFHFFKCSKTLFRAEGMFGPQTVSRWSIIGSKKLYFWTVQICALESLLKWANLEKTLKFLQFWTRIWALEIPFLKLVAISGSKNSVFTTKPLMFLRKFYFIKLCWWLKYLTKLYWSLEPSFLVRILITGPTF